jgi:hypothetical protein
MERKGEASCAYLISYHGKLKGEGMRCDDSRRLQIRGVAWCGECWRTQTRRRSGKTKSDDMSVTAYRRPLV